jgi:hypothetical protein
MANRIRKPKLLVDEVLGEREVVRLLRMVPVSSAPGEQDEGSMKQEEVVSSRKSSRSTKKWTAAIRENEFEPQKVTEHDLTRQFEQGWKALRSIAEEEEPEKSFVGEVEPFSFVAPGELRSEAEGCRTHSRQQQ